MNFAVAVGTNQHALVQFRLGFAIGIIMPKAFGKSGIFLGWIQMMESQRFDASISQQEQKKT
jgi:hypothetical protein